MKKCILLFSLLVVVFSCENNTNNESEISKIPIDFDVERFDIAFAETEATGLKRLKEAYPFMFPVKYPDSFWLERINDTLQQELSAETKKAFQDFKSTKTEITKLFQHLKYYYPEFKTPRVVTTTSSVDYRNKVIVTDSIIFIALDTYLGTDHKFYETLQAYIKADMKKEQIVVDLAEAYANKYSFKTQSKTLLDEMITTGKKLYFKDVMLPFKTDAEKIGYTSEQLEWAKANESYIWRYFVDRELLFDTDAKLPSRFIINAPFSKFYLEDVDTESPGKIGQYIGWQIVRSYMKHNDVSFKDMLNKSAEDIFNKSKFKPRK
ncbi:gliding motility lipoprotein GldB [Lacinutrix salivirga]